MKYILEIDFETERHCLLCPVRDEETDDCKMQYCKEFTNWEEQMTDCPLKLVDTDMLEKQEPKKVVETPDKHKYGYCPVCGRIYWDKCHVGNYCDNCGQRLEVEL